jgi:hypothetical protein
MVQYMHIFKFKFELPNDIALYVIDYTGTGTTQIYEKLKLIL